MVRSGVEVRPRREARAGGIGLPLNAGIMENLDVTKLVRFERDDINDEVFINPAHVRYIEDAPRSKRDMQPMTRLHLGGGEPLVVRGEMDTVVKTLEAGEPTR